MNDGKKRSREEEQDSEEDYEVCAKNCAKLALIYLLLVVSVLVLLQKSLSRLCAGQSFNSAASIGREPSDAGSHRSQQNGGAFAVDDAAPPPRPPPRRPAPPAGWYSCERIRLRRLLVTVLGPRVQAASLRRYRKVHKLGESPPGSSKEELLPAVARHFAAQASSCLFM